MPVGQERGVKTFAAEESPDAAGTFGLIGFGRNTEFVLGGESSALGLSDDFGIGLGGGGTLFPGCPPTPELYPLTQ